jgi:Mg-chelatase subunit ChlD
MVQQCSTSGGDWVRWYGCVGSRAYPDETRDANYSVRIPGLMNVTCGSPILEATNDLTLAKSRINALTTSGETYIPAGLIWGWRSLSAQAPLGGRASQAGLSVNRNMILVTDGQNTRSPTYPHHNGSSTADANAITRATCENMAADKASNIKLYTIAFEVTDAAVKQLLEECSTMNGGAFYDAANAAQLQDAMKSIGGQISRLRITH